MKLKIVLLAPILCAVSLFISIQSEAQSKFDQHSVDSLKSLVDSYTEKDSVWVNLVYDYIYEKQFSLDTSDCLFILETAKIANEINYIKGEARMFNFLGWNEYQNSEFKKALVNFYKAEKLFIETQNFMQSTDVKISIANTYLALQHYDEALETYLESTKYYDTIPDSPAKARLYFYTAKCYGAMTDFDNAEKYYIQTKKIALNSNFPMGVSIANASLGDTYLGQQRFKKALPLIVESHQLILSGGESLNLAASYVTLGKCFLGLKKYSSAKENLIKGKNMFASLDNYVQLKDVYVKLAKVYQYESNDEVANNYIDSAFSVADSVYSSERLEQIEELKTQYETVKITQEKELAETNEKLAQANAKRSKIWSFVTVVIAILIAVFLWIIASRLKIIRFQKKELDKAYLLLGETKKNELAASNLKAIKSQMNPHFIFNSINSIQDLVLQQETIKSYDYLVVFSNLVRKILDFSEKEFISIDEEVKFLHTYLGLEKLRFNDEFTYEIVNSLSNKSELIPSLIIQPFVENAIKHGLLHKKGPKNLKIEFIETDVFTCIIEDNGIGLTASEKIKKRQRPNHNSFATEAVKNRLGLLSSQMDGRAEYFLSEMTNENGKVLGTKVEFIWRF